jgi:hypothetical protein
MLLGARGELVIETPFIVNGVVKVVKPATPSKVLAIGHVAQLNSGGAEIEQWFVFSSARTVDFGSPYGSVDLAAAENRLPHRLAPTPSNEDDLAYLAFGTPKYSADGFFSFMKEVLLANGVNDAWYLAATVHGDTALPVKPDSLADGASMSWQEQGWTPLHKTDAKSAWVGVVNLTGPSTAPGPFRTFFCVQAYREDSEGFKPAREGTPRYEAQLLGDSPPSYEDWRAGVTNKLTGSGQLKVSWGIAKEYMPSKWVEYDSPQP